MAKNSIIVTVSLNDDFGRTYHSCSRTFYGNFTEWQYYNLKSDITHLLKQTLTASLDNYILYGEDNSNDQD